MDTEQYIEHEVQLRFMRELNDSRHIESNNRFKKMDERMDRMEQTLLKVLSLMKITRTVCGLIAIPVLLHYFKLA